jgi:predicted GIY-YIG superfamily endonuclease
VTKPAVRWWVYIVRCADGSLYTGIAVDVARRVARHNTGRASKYTRSRRPVVLAYRERQPDRGAALRREAAIKALTRHSKEALIARKVRR